MRKEAWFQYSRSLRPHAELTAAASGTPTAYPRKGQKNNPMDNADIPYETRARLRKKNSKNLARSMERAGGKTTIQGRPYAAVLEERGVNPNIAKQNINYARVLSDDIYKSAMYHAFADELEKVSAADVDPENPGARGYGVTAAGPMLVGGAVGATLGGGLGFALRRGAMNRGAGMLGGAAAGGLFGAGLGYSSLKSAPLAANFEQGIRMNADRAAPPQQQ
ncbi:MAG: hypothetical protein ACO32I_01175 [Candidatus Limnocylindrus sp.]